MAINWGPRFIVPSETLRVRLSGAPIPGITEKKMGKHGLR
jgi:hypothetical protein